MLGLKWTHVFILRFHNNVINGFSANTKFNRPLLYVHASGDYYI